MTASAGFGRTTCDVIQAQSFAACDAELTHGELVAIDAHLRHCGPCRTKLTADAVFVRALRAASIIDVAPSSLRERIAHLLQQHATENASA